MVEVNSGENVQKFDSVKQYILNCLETNKFDVDKESDKFAR